MVFLKEKFEKNKYWLLYSLAVTYLWGLAAHAYCFFDNSVSHNSLKEFHVLNVGNKLKLGFGRFFVPIYRALFRGDATLPWLIGILGLLWLGLTVFLIIRIFRADSKILTFLIAGVLVTNISVSALAATYIHDFDCNLFGILCAVSAVYFWRGYTSPGATLLGAALIAASLGIYQSYIFVAVTLAMMICIFSLLDGENFKSVMVHGLQAIAMMVLGGIFYFIALKVVSGITKIPLSSAFYNFGNQSVKFTPRTFLEVSIGAYRDWFSRLWNAYSPYPRNVVKVITLLLFGISTVSLAAGLLHKRVHKWEKVLCLVLIILFPYGTNFINVMAHGECHDLVVYAIWLFYLFALLLTDRLEKLWKVREHANEPLAKAGSYAKVLCLVLVFILLYGNVQFANGMYLKKDNQYDAYLSLMTRVVSRMENEPAYVPGETPVYFAGLPEDLNDEIPGFEEYTPVTGMWSMDVLFTNQRERFQAYFDYVLCTPIKLADDEQWLAMQEKAEVQAMPNYPAQGCIKMVDGILVVKLGDPRAIV